MMFACAISLVLQRHPLCAISVLYCTILCHSEKVHPRARFSVKGGFKHRQKTKTTTRKLEQRLTTNNHDKQMEEHGGGWRNNGGEDGGTMKEDGAKMEDDEGKMEED